MNNNVTTFFFLIKIFSLSLFLFLFVSLFLKIFFKNCVDDFQGASVFLKEIREAVNFNKKNIEIAFGFIRNVPLGELMRERETGFTVIKIVQEVVGK